MTKRVQLTRISQTMLMTQKKMTNLSEKQIIEFALLNLRRLPTEQEKKQIKKKHGYFY